jgi:ribosomal protein S7
MTKRKENTNISDKLITHLTINGKKNKSEKTVLKSFKVLQKTSKKSSKKLFQLALVQNTPIFKINTITQKKRKKKKQKAKIIPAFIPNKFSRISFAVKFIVTTASKRKKQPIFKKLLDEILLSSQNKSGSIDKKKRNSKTSFFKSPSF